MNNKLLECKYLNSEKINLSDKLFLDCEKAIKKLRQEIHDKKLPALNIVEESDDLQQIIDIANYAKNYQKTVIIGVGGSSLGGKALCALKLQNKVDFIESIDPVKLWQYLENIDLKNTLFIVISKSGETIETICQTLIIIDLLKKNNFEITKNFIFITESVNSSIGRIATELKSQILFHNPKIGGRYSCFSIVGLLPALIVGLDIFKIREGANIILQDFLKNDDLMHSSLLQLNIYDNGFINNVMMPYIDDLKNYTDWYRQLQAESLGKNSLSFTPINSMGTVDQHSQLQLYLEGKKDKFFTFIVSATHSHDFLISDLNNCQTLFSNKKLSQILAIEYQTTIQTLVDKFLPVRIFTINNLDEKTIGALMMQMFLETIIMGYSMKINPYDQPAVEIRKEMAKNILKKK